MAKHIFIIEDREEHLEALNSAVNRAIEGSAIEPDDDISLVGATQDAAKVHIEICNLPTYKPCSKFEELTSIVSVHGDKVLLLDLALPGIHGTTGAEFFEDQEIPKFYAKLTNDSSARSVILLYSSSLQIGEKYDLIEVNGRKDRLHWLEKKPEDIEAAEEILYEGLNLFFNRPLHHPAIRLNLDALQTGQISRDEFEKFFSQINAGQQFPKGTLKWLTSGWVAEVYSKTSMC